MEPRKDHTQDKDFWEDVRDTVRDGVRELRNVGDELARQARLRMDVFQCERRLKMAQTALGEATYELLSRELPVGQDDSTISELTARIRYYSDELGRLREEQRKAPETVN